MTPLRLVYLKQDIIYGPVSSRRLGRSLGINLLGAGRKVCTFDCVYCQLRQPREYAVDYLAGATGCRRRCATCAYAHPFPASDAIAHSLPSVDAILVAVSQAVSENAGLASLTLSGNGEPTAYPHFLDLVEGLVDLRDRLCPGTAITVLSNSSTLWRPSVVKALNRLDRRIMKLDAGDEATLRATNRPCPGTGFASIVEGLAALKNVTLQTLFVDGPSGNAAPEQVERWLAALRLVKPREVQLYSLDRVPAEGDLGQVSRERLAEIAAAAEAATGAPVSIY